MNAPESELVLLAGFEAKSCPLPAALEGRDFLDLEAWDVETPLPEQVPAVTLIVRSVTDLRRVLALEPLLPRASAVTLVIHRLPAWRCAVLASPGDESLWQSLLHTSSTRDEDGAWRVATVFADPVEAGTVFASVVRMLDGHRVGGLGPLAGPTGPGEVGEPTPGNEIRRTDHNISRGALRSSNTARGIGVRRQVNDGPDPFAAVIPPIDERSVNPIGFLRRASEGMGTLTWGADGFVIALPGDKQLALPSSGLPTELEMDRLRTCRGVRAEWREARNAPESAARILMNLAAAGVPVSADADEAWARVTDPGFAELITSGTVDLTDELSREQHSIRLRRHALRGYGIHGYWSGQQRRLGLSPLERQVSVLLCTTRPDLVGFALGQAAHQAGVGFEVILVLHGFDQRHPKVAGAIAAFEHPLVVVEVDESVPYGEALNLGAWRAQGYFIAKMDDDDWYGRHYLADMQLVHTYSGADSIGCSGGFIYLEGPDITVRGNMLPLEAETSLAESPCWRVGDKAPAGFPVGAPGGTVFITRHAYQAVGGYKPVHIFEDTELNHSVRAAGGRIHRTHGLNYLYRRRADASSHLWKAQHTDFLHPGQQTWPGRYFNDLMELPSDEPFC